MIKNPAEAHKHPIGSIKLKTLLMKILSQCPKKKKKRGRKIKARRKDEFRQRRNNDHTRSKRKGSSKKRNRSHRLTLRAN